MVGSRLDLQEMLEQLLGSPNVYFRPPSDEQKEYPAIFYSIDKRSSIKANNKKYINRTAYQLIYVDEDPDNAMIPIIINLPYCEHVDTYDSDGMGHDVFTLYY